jgi:hypothetical protein
MYFYRTVIVANSGQRYLADQQRTKMNHKLQRFICFNCQTKIFKKAAEGFASRAITNNQQKRWEYTAKFYEKPELTANKHYAYNNNYTIFFVFLFLQEGGVNYFLTSNNNYRAKFARLYG